MLGDDAEQFTTNDDAAAFVEPSGDPTEGDNAPSTFESQFPDLASPSAVRVCCPWFLHDDTNMK